MTTMQRHNFQHDGLNLSYLDTGGVGEILIALHSHWMEGQTDARSEWRQVAGHCLSVNGHGYSGHASTYVREDYLRDLSSLRASRDLQGRIAGQLPWQVNAYQFAERHPDYVRALIVEDIGAVVGDDTSFALSWSGVFKSSQDLEERIGPLFYISQGLGALSRWRVASRVRA